MFLKHIFGFYYNTLSFDYTNILEAFKNSLIEWLLLFMVGLLLLYLVTRLLCNGLDDGGIHYVNTKRSALPMQALHNPFSFDVNIQQATYSGIECTFSCEKDSYLLVVWGVPIYDLFSLLNSNPSDLKNSITAFIENEKFSSRCKSSNDVLLLKGGEKKTMVFTPHRGYVDEADIRPKEAFVRLNYPFVAITLLQDLDVADQVVIAMATVVHLPDEALKLPAQIIAQHVKFPFGSVCTIRKIFVSSPEASNVDGENVDLCLACYHRAISVVIMPCGHACVCITCLEFCKNCPICRGPAYSYFELQSIPRQ